MKKLMYIGLLTTLIITMAACSKKTDKDKDSKENESTIEQQTDSEAQEDTATVDESIYQQLVVSVGKEKIYYSEAMIYFKYIEAQYESYFGDKIWAYDFGEQNFGEMAKQEIINMIAQTKIIGTQVEKYKVVLTEEDEVLIKENSEKFLAGLTDKDKMLYGLTADAAQLFYRDNMLYEKVYDAATMNVNTEVSDEEAKQIKVQHILVLTTETSADGKSTTPMSEEKKAKAYAKAKELLKEAKKAEDFYTFAEANTEDSGVEYTFGKGEMDKAFETAAFALKAGELSGIVETKLGYQIIYCVSNYDEDATLEKKEEIIEVRQDKAFKELYKKWSKDYDININDKVWDTMNFSSELAEESTEESTMEPTVEPTKVPVEG